jgi:hypothetical protein
MELFKAGYHDANRMKEGAAIYPKCFLAILANV